ncbi:MAG: hypothetical protein JW769_04300 [Parachlamydiales bacterium]|nr:hypothetical protein [Parachlamydiales bacterium]
MPIFKFFLRWKKLVKHLLWIFVFFLCAGTISEMPSLIMIKEQYFSWMPSFNITSEKGSHGKIVKKFLSLTPQYTYIDDEGELVAKASAHFFSWGVFADVVDHKEKKIGSIEEKIFTLSPCEFSIFNRDNQLIATAKMNFWRTHFDVKDPKGHEVALLERPFLRFFVNEWKLIMIDPSMIAEDKIDPRLLMMCAVYRLDSERHFERLHKFNKTTIGAKAKKYWDTLRADTQKFIHKSRKTIRAYSQYSDRPLDVKKDMELARLEFDKKNDEPARGDDPVSLEQWKEMVSEHHEQWIISVIETAFQKLEDPRVSKERKGAIYRLLNAFLQELQS